MDPDTTFAHGGRSVMTDDSDELRESIKNVTRWRNDGLPESWEPDPPNLSWILQRSEGEAGRVGHHPAIEVNTSSNENQGIFR